MWIIGLVASANTGRIQPVLRTGGLPDICLATRVAMGLQVSLTPGRWRRRRAGRYGRSSTELFVLPALPTNLTGRHGCNLRSITFDRSIGEEICAVYMEEPAFADQYGKVHPFNLIAHTGLARTPHGVVAFIVWRIAAQSPHEVLIEQS